ncbi:MAG TPA: hypothetical protein VJP39_05790 [Gaiellaceae bacterium]|nr:hypothetical protein [Gaiellaceae bacterium]
MRRGLVLALLLAIALSVPSAGATNTSFRIAEFRFVDTSRTAHFANGRVAPRGLVTYVRIPSGRGPFPLVVFGHGFASTPALYAVLLDAWACAGFIVAAPLFPVENAEAPGGPDERDIVNQPGDLSFVISRLLRMPSLHIAPGEIAVAGQSDGAEAAYAVAEESHYRDARVRAAVVLSGAELGGGTPIAGPPLLAVQGTRDRINPPRYSTQLYDASHRPKFLLWLLGSGHIAPYTTRDAAFSVVSRVTVAFLDHYLKRAPLAAVFTAAKAPNARLRFSR